MKKFRAIQRKICRTNVQKNRFDSKKSHRVALA